MKTRAKLLATVIGYGLLAACGGGGGSSGSGSSAVTVVTTAAVTPAPTPTAAVTPTPTATPSATPTATPTPAATPTTWAGQAAALYDVQPDVAGCRAGTLKASVKADVLTRLNAIRALHGLPPVTYSADEDAQEAASSLMMAVNKQLSHTPPSTWTCYSADGAAAAGASNLVGGWGTGLGFSSEDDYLGMWLTEIGSASIGHRRWLLDPFLGSVSYGRVAAVLADGSRASAASLRVFSFGRTPAAPAASAVPSFVAYPQGEYPSRYFAANAFLSFTVVANASGRFGANSSIGYAAARVTVTGPSGSLAVSDVTSDNTGYGVANSIQWHVAGLQTGVTYTVQITGITGAPKADYSYTFRIS